MAMISPRLYEIAKDWEVWRDDEGHLRCSATGCDQSVYEPVYGAPVAAIVNHLLLAHGYRMDGHQYDNQNNQLDQEETAAGDEQS